MSIKRILNIWLACFMTTTVCFGQWSAESRVDLDDLNAYTSPRIVYSDIPVILYGSRQGELYATHQDPIQGWVTQNITQGVPTAFVTDWASAELHSEGSTVVISYKEKDQQNGHTRLAISTDGGRNFTDPVIFLNGDSSLHRFPYAIATPDGDIMLSAMIFEENFLEPQYEVFRMTQNGQMMDEYTIPNPMGEACDCCTSHLIQNQNQVGLLFRNNKSNLRDIHFSVYESLSNSFESPVDLNMANWEIFGCPSTSSNGIMTDSRVIAPHISAHEGNRSIYLSVVDLENLDLITDRALLSNRSDRVIYDSPEMAGNGDTLGVVWQETASGRSSIYFSYSTSGEEMLGLEKIRVSDDSLSRLVNPSIAYHQGVFHFTWTNNSRGAVFHKSFNVNGLTQVQNNDNNPSTVLQSNLVHNQLSFNQPIFKYQVMSADGQSFLNGNDLEQKISISHLPKGTYFIRYKLANDSPWRTETFVRM